MGILDGLNLPTLAEMQAIRRATPKHAIVPRIIEREKKKADKKQNAETFRKAVWRRDGGKCRATKKHLAKSGLDDLVVGEVDHVIDRSLAPDRVYDVSNGILIAKRLNRLKKVACLRAPEFRMFSIVGPDDRAKRQRFLWRDEDGKVIRETRG